MSSHLAPFQRVVSSGVPTVVALAAPLLPPVFFPFQMMQNLLLEEGGLVQVESVNLQVATYSKFQPQSPDFLDITNPKAVYPEVERVPLSWGGLCQLVAGDSEPLVGSVPALGTTHLS